MELIDRKKVMSDIRNMTEIPAEMRVRALAAVSRAKAVDAKPVVHGRWKIEWEYERDSITGECDETPVATCPFCGYREYGLAHDDYWGMPHNYCPNCGAKMDGGAEVAELKPCPFCGGKAEFVKKSTENGNGTVGFDFAQADPFTMAGFDTKTVREMLEARAKTGLSAETIIAFYRKFKMVVKEGGK